MNDAAGSEIAVPPDQSPRLGSRVANALWILVPLCLFGLAAAWLVIADPLRAFSNGAPPVEKLTFERRSSTAPASICWFGRAGPSR